MKPPQADDRPTLLIVSQVYVPDPAALGQYMHDAAARIAERGWRVIVYTSARGYDDPTQRYPRREMMDGVEVRRLPWSSFGKSSIKVRLIAQLLFMLQATVRGFFTRRLKRVLVSTSPPMAGAAGWIIGGLRRVPFAYWVMDINPDQAIAMGKVGPRSLFARLFGALNGATLKRAAAVITLDRYMAERLQTKQAIGQRLHIIPPWPLADSAPPLPHDANPFRAEHGLTGKRVIMYSGNLSPAHPIDTVLDAAKMLHAEQRVVFVFIGSRAVREEIEAFRDREGLSNILTLPYQPLDTLRESLSAADLQLITMGNDMTGIVHPCKVYGAMAVSRPVLLVGPSACHIGELIEQQAIGWQADHGDSTRVVSVIKQVLEMDESQLAEAGEASRAALDEDYKRDALRDRFCDLIISSGTKGSS